MKGHRMNKELKAEGEFCFASESSIVNFMPWCSWKNVRTQFFLILHVERRNYFIP